MTASSREEVARDVRALQRLLVAVNALALAVALVGHVLDWRWWSPTIAVVLGTAAYVGYLRACRWPRWSTNLFAFGLSAGLVELAADHWLVHGTGTLVYPPGGPFVVSSPLYMPLAWAAMLTSHAALGLAWARRMGTVRASVAVAAVAAVVIPAYEAIATHADWWYYRNTPMWLEVVPVYIVIGEAIIMLPVAVCARWLLRATAEGAVLAGMAMGGWIFAGYAVSHAWFGS